MGELETAFLDADKKAHMWRLAFAEAENECHRLHRGLEWLALALGIEQEAHYRNDFFRLCIHEVKRLRAGDMPAEGGE